MFATDDTIVAIATPPGRAALGVVRLSGARAADIAAQLLERSDPLQPRHATFTRVRSNNKSTNAATGGPDKACPTFGAAVTPDALDEVVVTLFAAPHSYTGEHIVEITTHGSPVVLQAVLRRALDAGARLARPGEFTLRAFLNGKRDLIQSEAVADLIEAATPLQARVAFDQLDGTLTRRIAAIDAALFDVIARLEASLDFPDEGYHFVEPSRAALDIATVIAAIDGLLADAMTGRMIREGATVVIAGRTNVGKSSIFNTLTGVDRAIVTAIPGTTRDLVTETVDIEGVAVSLVDTAGWRETLDVVEREGVERGSRARGVADLILLVLDQSDSTAAEDAQLLDETARAKRIVVLNKCDLADPPSPESGFGVAGGSDIVRALSGPSESPVARVSALTGEGFAVLRQMIARELAGGDVREEHRQRRDAAPISNIRHVRLLEECRASLEAARTAAEAENVPEEFLLIDLQAARVRLDEIVGRRTSEDVLHHIFDRFCIGK